jgi:hypothetical protein
MARKDERIGSSKNDSRHVLADERAPVVSLDVRAVDNILEHVGIDHTPNALDKLELRRDIIAAWDFYWGYRREDHKRDRTKRRKFAAKIAATADKLYQQLNDPDSPEAELFRTDVNRRLSMEYGIDLDLFNKGIEIVCLIAQSTTRLATGPSSLRQVLDVSPGEWFLGHDLKKVFEKHFGMKAVRTRSADGRLEGAYMRFATAATASLGEPFTDETVSKAMSAVEAGEANSSEE